MEKLLEFAYTNGIWAFLFVWLFVYQLKDSSSREKKYQSIIDDLTEKFSLLDSINTKVDKLVEEHTND